MITDNIDKRTPPGILASLIIMVCIIMHGGPEYI